MDEREKIIREDYPVEKLPEDLREGLGAATRVRVTVETAGEPISAGSKGKRWDELQTMIEALHTSPTFKPVTAEEAVRRVRALRDEWND